MERANNKSNLAKSLLFGYKKITDKRLDLFFTQEIQRIANLSAFSRLATIELAKLTLNGGKRLRAALAYYAYKMFEGKKEKEMKKTSIFIELIQSYLIIHDDIIDRSEERRGSSTIHKTFSDYWANSFPLKDHKHFGESIAICIGDLSCHLALRLLADSNFDDRKKITAMKKINAQISTVTHGEMADILLESRKEVSEKEVIDMLNWKTSTYTYETPVHVGAILAGADRNALKILSEYSINAGIGFQIQDDILGLFGEKEKTGKSIYSDLTEGKKTLLIVRALKEAGKRDKKEILKALGNKKLTRRAADKVRKIIIKTGALDYSKRLALGYIGKAKKALQKIKINNEGKDFLEGIADYMIDREF